MFCFYQIWHLFALRALPTAFNLSALSDCSTGPSPLLVYTKFKVDLVVIPGQCWLSMARPICPLSLDFRSNGSSQSENLSAMWNITFPCPLKLRFCVPRWKRNDTFYIFACICKKFALFCLSQGLCSRKRCQRQYELGPAPRRLRPRPRGDQSVWAAAEGRGEEGRPDLSATNTGTLVAGVEYSLWHWSAWRMPKKRLTIYFYCTEGHETWVLRTWIGGLSHSAQIFWLRWTVCSEIERKWPNRTGCGQWRTQWGGHAGTCPSLSDFWGPWPKKRRK